MQAKPSQAEHLKQIRLITRIMINYFIKIIVIALITATLTACSDEAKLQPLAADATILAFGDSLRQL